MTYTTEIAEKVAHDASPEAAIWIRELAKQRDQLREALGRAADDLGMIARVEKNYMAESAAERCRSALKVTEDL